MAAGADSRFAGMWEGTTNDLPSVELTVAENGGVVSGSIAFYFQQRGEDGKWQLGRKTSLPLLTPRMAGNVLTFETTHRKRHDSPELGLNNQYRVTFVDAGEARLRILNAPGASRDSGPGLKLMRRK